MNPATGKEMSQVMATRHDGARPTDPPSLQWKMSCEVEVRVTTRQRFLVEPGEVFPGEWQPQDNPYSE